MFYMSSPLIFDEGFWSPTLLHRGILQSLQEVPAGSSACEMQKITEHGWRAIPLVTMHIADHLFWFLEEICVVLYHHYISFS